MTTDRSDGLTVYQENLVNGHKPGQICPEEWWFTTFSW